MTGWRNRRWVAPPAWRLAAIFCLAASTSYGANPPIRNEKVAVTELKLAPGETLSFPAPLPAVLVFRTAGAVRAASGTFDAKPGAVWFLPAGQRSLQNTGASELSFVRVEFSGRGASETWGASGLAPNYKVLLENEYARVYDIRIPAHSNEPQHTHKTRVVICLSGARLRHLMPDGREEPSTLETGEIAWRPGGTHIGQNIGDTNLWVIAVEPK